MKNSFFSASVDTLYQLPGDYCYGAPGVWRREECCVVDGQWQGGRRTRRVLFRDHNIIPHRRRVKERKITSSSKMTNGDCLDGVPRLPLSDRRVFKMTTFHSPPTTTSTNSYPRKYYNNRIL